MPTRIITLSRRHKWACTVLFRLGARSLVPLAASEAAREGTIIGQGWQLDSSQLLVKLQYALRY